MPGVFLDSQATKKETEEAAAALEPAEGDDQADDDLEPDGGDPTGDADMDAAHFVDETMG